MRCCTSVKWVDDDDTPACIKLILIVDRGTRVNTFGTTFMLGLTENGSVSQINFLTLEKVL